MFIASAIKRKGTRVRPFIIWGGTSKRIGKPSNRTVTIEGLAAARWYVGANSDRATTSRSAAIVNNTDLFIVTSLLYQLFYLILERR
jgi:thiamine biosynthesis lipoprotein ApbE